MADNLNNIGGPDAMFGDGSALLPEYEPYLIATIEQEGEGGAEATTDSSSRRVKTTRCINHWVTIRLRI